MLSIMRKHASSWMIKFILGAVILAFIPFGYGIYQDRRDLEVASVNGDSILYDEYNRVYNNLIVQMRQQFGDALNEETIKMLNLKQQAMDRLVEERLLLSEAKRLNLKVSDQELAESIAGIEAFQTAGTFDPRRYAYILERNRLTQEDFEAQQKQALLVAKLNRLISASAKVSDAEAAEWYRWNNAAVNIDFVAFSPANIEDVELTEEEMRAYFEENAESYKTEPEIKVRYLRFAPEAYRSKVELTDKEIRQYYDINTSEFVTPKTVEARHILIKVADGASEEDVEKARKKAEEVLKLAREGQDFAELAKTHSEGPSGKNGGYLGSFKKEDMVEPFSNAAFAMQAGEISDLVRTRFGWHIIKVEKVNEGSTRSFEEAREGIRNKLVNEGARAIAQEEAEQVYDVTFVGEDLVRNARDRNLTIHETDFFVRAKGPAKGVREPAPFANVAFEINEMEISEIQEYGDGFYILQPIERREPKIPEFESVAERVKTDLVKQRRQENARQQAEAFLAALKEGKTLADEAERVGVKVESSGYFKRNAAIPKVGYNPDIARASFALSADNRLAEQIFSVGDRYYVIQFASRQEPAEEDFEKEKEQVRRQLRQQKQVRTMENWLADKRKNSEILIEESVLQ
jgi:peptidyl-prolyl cis-trans isomerase D